MSMRLLLALLIAALAAPAVAMPACHAPETASASTGPHDGHRMAMPSARASIDPRTVDHGPAETHPHDDSQCIGCIAPSTVRPPMLWAPLAPEAALRMDALSNDAPLGGMPPATPPPRLPG